MDIFSVFSLLGGLALFLYGMTVMSKGLEQIGGGKFENSLKKMTSNPFKGMMLGAGITALIQSSSAMTVMLVGFVNSGIMTLRQTIGIIMGSNIGTTITAWILSLVGIQSDNFFIQLIKPKSFSPLLAFIGILMIMACKSNKKKNTGNILLGFAILMYGMSFMESAVSPLKDIPEFKSIFTAFSNPILGVIAGALFTAVIQSSSASVGILQALSLTGSITFGAALPIIMGQNIGTCITALISSIGVNKNAKRVAVVHISFNVIGTILFLTLFYLCNWIFKFPFTANAINPWEIAIVHSIFNVTNTFVLLPFAKHIEKLAMFLVKDSEKAETYTILDDRLLRTPSIAIAECNKVAVEMSKIAKDNILSSIGLLSTYNQKRADAILEFEEKLDNYEDRLGTFLVQLSTKELSQKDSNDVSKLLHVIGDFERIGDHAVNLLRVAQEKHNKEIKFSEQANSELNVVADALKEILDISIDAFGKNDVDIASKVEPLEQVIDSLIIRVKSRHIKRLKQGNCTIELGFVLSDILANYERISDHCSNIAVCVIQIKDSSFDTHDYLNNLKTSGQPEFINSFEGFKSKYVLPQ